MPIGTPGTDSVTCALTLKLSVFAVQFALASATRAVPIRPSEAGVLVGVFVGGTGVLVGVADTLSQREREVLRLVAKGLSNTEIAMQLFLSEGTVRNYVSGLFAKLGVTDRTQAAVIALRHGRLKSKAEKCARHTPSSRCALHRVEQLAGTLAHPPPRTASSGSWPPGGPAGACLSSLAAQASQPHMLVLRSNV